MDAANGSSTRTPSKAKQKLRPRATLAVAVAAAAVVLMIVYRLAPSPDNAIAATGGEHPRDRTTARRFSTPTYLVISDTYTYSSLT
ncbi:hypothetical protein ACP4OV_011156 [Aristida adscensionis]